ncbi:hypothetical protein KAJ27_19790, partial [bacterium]|nr:hypothetical protein [bacterium]
MKKQRGMAVPIALLLSVMFLMFAVMVMTVQKSTAKFTKKLNVELKAHYLALGGVQHTLLKIKELREYFYDALKWGYHVDDTSGKFVVHDTVPDPRYIHPITRVEVDATHKASDKTEAMKYLDYFKCDIFSYTYYSTIEDGNEAGVAPTSTSGIVKSGGSIKTDDAINTISDPSLGYKKGAGGPGWVSSSDYGDPFDGEYHMSNLGNDATDPIKAGYSSGTDGIAEIISGGTISGNTATILNSWVRKKDL